MADNKEIIGIDYAKEYEILKHENQQLSRELELYKQALVNICSKI